METILADVPDDRLLADYTACVEVDLANDKLGMSSSTARYRDEILRRLAIARARSFVQRANITDFGGMPDVAHRIGLFTDRL